MVNLDKLNEKISKLEDEEVQVQIGDTNRKQLSNIGSMAYIELFNRNLYVRTLLKENEELVEKSEFENLTAEQTWEKLYGKKLNCKKHILEYIEITRILKKENVSQEKIEETYHFIIEGIESLTDIKPNTMMHLKNTLNTQLGKFVKEDPDSLNHFIEFFKSIY